MAKLSDWLGLIVPDIAPERRLLLAMFCIAWLAILLGIAAWFLLGSGA